MSGVIFRFFSESLINVYTTTYGWWRHLVNTIRTKNCMYSNFMTSSHFLTSWVRFWHLYNWNGTWLGTVPY